jgi:hypothetical protein
MDKHAQFLVIIYHKGDIWIKVCHSLIPTLLSTVPWGHRGDQTVRSSQLRGCPDPEQPRQYKVRYQILLGRIERKSSYASVAFAYPTKK